MQPSPFLFTVQLLDRNQSLPGPFCRYYSLFTLAMLVMFESTVVTQRLRNLKELRSLQNPKQPIMVYRQGKWEKLPGDALLPGDVISIGRPAGGEFAAAIYLHNQTDPGQDTQPVPLLSILESSTILLAIAASEMLQETSRNPQASGPCRHRSASVHSVDGSVSLSCLFSNFKGGDLDLSFSRQ